MKKTIIKILRIIFNVILYAFMIVCLFGIVLTIFSKKDIDNTAIIFGYQMRIVQSPSMEESEFTDTSEFEIKDLPVKTVIFIEVVPEDEAEREAWFADIKDGDVLTFKYLYTRQETITHRVVDKIAKETGGYLIYLEGDNKASEEGVLTQVIDTSDENSPNYVIGKVVGHNYPLGLLVYALKSPIGLIFIIFIPCLVIIIFEVVRIINVLNAEKKAKAKAKEEEQLNELEELKRKLAVLEQKTQDKEGE